MPLIPGDAAHIVSTNIAELRKTGRPEAQAIAIAMKHAGKTKKKPKPKMAMNSDNRDSDYE